MKFGHLLKSFEADAPDAACLDYKKLKKLIKAQAAHNGSTAEGDGAAAAAAAAAQVAAAAAAAGHVAEEDREFIAALNDDLARVNAYYIDAEEGAVIRLRALEDRLSGSDGSGSSGGANGVATMGAAELEQLRNQMVDFHGELVLLLHWSLMNYAAVAKILKKHDKMTGSRLRTPVLASVLQQPFLSTENISQLVKQAEQHVQELTQLCGNAARGASHDTAAEGSSDEAGRDPEQALSADHVAIYKRTRAALQLLNDMQEKASTPSTLLPPGASSDAPQEDSGKKQKLAEQQQQQQQAAVSGSQHTLEQPLLQQQ